jgi:hypothetical protein
LIPAAIFSGKKQFQNNNPFSHHHQKLANHHSLTSNLNEHIQSINRAKKQLEFSGPECWINFKFDLSSIVADLPPTLEL